MTLPSFPSLNSVTHGAQDYRCPECSAVRENVRATWAPVPESIRTYKGEEYKKPVYCTACLTDRNRYVEMDWQPQRAAHDLLTGGTGLQVDIDGTLHTFSSAHEMHRFAAESQRIAANEEGKSPVNFRALHQNRQNMGQNTLAGSSFERSRQIPHEEIGKTSRGRHISRGVMTREEAERRGYR